METNFMLSSAVLEYHVPGVIVSVRIPSDYIESIHSNKQANNQESNNQIVDINVKKLFNHLVPRIAEIDNIAVSSNNNGIEVNNKKSKNIYDNIIDKLERKYYLQSNLSFNHLNKLAQSYLNSIFIFHLL